MLNYLITDEWTETNFSGKQRTKSVPPKPDGLVAHIDASLMQQVFDFSKRRRKANIDHLRQTDNTKAGFELAKT